MCVCVYAGDYRLFTLLSFGKFLILLDLKVKDILLRSRMSKGRLKPEDEEIIQRNYEYLKSELEASHLLDNLYQNKVINLEDKIRISSGRTKSDRNEDLLLTILHSGPGASFKCFLSCLQRKYPHVRKQLEKKDDVNTKTLESTKDNTTLRTEIEHLRHVVNDNISQIQRLKKESANKDVKIEDLITELMKVKAERAQKDVKIENLSTELMKVKSERAKKDVKIENLITEIMKVKTERAQKDVKIENLSTELMRVNSERAQKNVKIENLSTELMKVNSERAQKDVKIENLSTEIMKVKAERDEPREQKMALEAENKQLKESLAKRSDNEIRKDDFQREQLNEIGINLLKLIRETLLLKDLKYDEREMLLNDLQQVRNSSQALLMEKNCLSFQGK